MTLRPASSVFIGARPPQQAEGFWTRWVWWATHARLAPVRVVAWLIKRHWSNIVTYFRHSITNAVREGLNSKIQTIKKMAYGFRNQEHFKTALYFHCGGLDLYPRFPEEPKKKIATTPAIAASAAMM